MATKRVQTQYQQNQVRLRPQATPVDTFVRPARNDQISKALDSVTGNVQRVQQKEERKLDMIQASKKQAAQNSFGIGFRDLMSQEKFARMSPEQLLETPEYQKLFNGSLDQVDDVDLKGVLSNSMSQTANATSLATSSSYQRSDLMDAGTVFGSNTIDLFIENKTAGYKFNPDGSPIYEPDGLSQEQLNEETEILFSSHAADIEGILKKKYGYSNSDLQEFWLKEQERRGELYMDTLIGDHLIKAGNGGPEYRNKVLALIEKAKTNKLIKDSVKVTDDIIGWQSIASSGKLTDLDKLELRQAEEAGRIPRGTRLAIINADSSARATQAAQVRKDGAMAAVVANNLTGQFDLNAGTWVDANNKTQTISKADSDRATQNRINQIAEAKFPDGNAEGILAAKINMYSRVNVMNEEWQHEISKAFDFLGTGDFSPDSPLWKTTMNKFQLMKQLHSGNPQMFKKYLKSTEQRAMFTEWRVMSAYGVGGEQDALRALGSADHLQGKAGSKDLMAFSDEVVKNLDTWTNWDDVAGDDEDVKTLFKEKMVEYAKVIAKYTNMNPKQVVEAYMDEVKLDHSVVNGKLVFMGNMDIDNNQFQADAQLYLEQSIDTIANGSFNADQLTLRHTGRGDTFWIVDLAGRVLPTAPLHLKSFYNLDADQTLATKQAEANKRQASQ